MKNNRKFDVLIIGGGINGLTTAYHLSNHKNLKVGLIEQFSLGHSHGSSHGSSRIFRSTYLNPVYVHLARHAQMFEWPSLEKDAGCQLIHPSSRCLFGEGSSFDAYSKTMLKNCKDLELLDVSTARRLFPQFRFAKALNVLQDPSSGIIAAKETMEYLAKMISNKNVEIHEETKVLKIDASSDLIRLETTKGPLTTERLVITAGPWINQFLSPMTFPFRPIKQIVGFFKLKGIKKSYQIDQFPNWVFIGEGENNVFYGLPEFGTDGIKVAQEITSGHLEDPDQRNGAIDSNRVKALENFVSEQFVEPIDHLVSLETCFYTNTPTSDFVLDLLPRDPRIAIGAACSGHAFKFAPLTGRILAELILFGKTTVAEFEEARELFSLKNPL